MSRHRRFHVLAPAKLLVAASQKDARAKAERHAIAEAVAEGNSPQIFFALSEIIKDLRRVHSRLDKGSEAAQAAGQLATLASLAGQELKLHEMRAKMGGVEGYRPAREQPNSEPASISININLGGEGDMRLTAQLPERQPTIKHADTLGPLPGWLQSLGRPTSDAEIEDEDE